MSNTAGNKLQRLSHQELRDLRLFSRHISGRRMGPRSLLIEVQAGDPRSKRPFFHLGYRGVDRYSIELGTDQPIYWLPTLARAQAPDCFIEVLASMYLEEIRSLQPEGPYLLGGECFGAWPALEIAQQLQNQGERVDVLMILDCGGPNPIYRNYLKISYPIYVFYRQQVLYRLEYHRQNLGTLDTLGQFTYMFKGGRRALRKIAAKIFDRDGYQPQLPASLDDILIRFDRAESAYIPQRYSGRVILFLARQGYFASVFFPMAGWGQILNGPVEIQLVPGDHMSYLELPFFLVIAKRMRKYLEEAQS